MQRGRKSAAAVAVIGPHGLETIRRPDPPISLTDEQADEWRKVTNAMAADYFSPETHALLEARCRAVVHGRRLSERIENEMASDEYDWKTHKELLHAQAEQAHIVAVLDTKMKLAQQTVYDKSTAKRKTGGKAPWATKED
jgi:hypothetical protein